MTIAQALLVGAVIGGGIVLALEHIVFPAVVRLVLVQARR